MTPSESRIQALLAQGRALLEGGRSREAALVFERVLLHDSDSAEARAGVERARAIASEEARRREAGVQAAHEAFAEGDRVRARVILEELLETGGERDAILSLLDRLDERQGLVTHAVSSYGSVAAAALPAPSASWWARRAFGLGWALLTLTLAGSVAASWDGLVTRLVEAPAPSTQAGPAVTRLPAPSAGDVALAEARELAERGDLNRALGALDAISPEDAAYPYARQMRERLANAGAEHAR